MDSILELVNNPIEVFEETSRLLLKIADNILKDPTNAKIRLLQKSNATVERKILQVTGGKACLAAMGFHETEHSFNLPINDTLNNLRQIRVEISRLKNGEKSDKIDTKTKTLPVVPTTVTNVQKTEINGSVRAEATNSVYVPSETFKRIVLPPCKYLFTNPFLRQIEFYFHRSLQYEYAYLQERALSVIPSKELERKAQDALRQLQERIKKERLKDPEVNLQDFLILELLAWFKSDFFMWVNSPACQHCTNGKMKMSHMSNDKELLVYTERVEMHKCDNCNKTTPFPRYEDLNILLETRKGRCGEWANTFTLMCRAMGWDARFVMDETDHVWTEVYSHSQKKWLHCDPCENACDAPLMYESGWGKTVSYVMAYSCEEVQDVTWRYTSHHEAVRARRTKCTEQQLVEAMVQLREHRQKTFTQSRRDYLRKRLLSEIVELMVERKAGDKEHGGRSSGSLDWRVTRGEAQVKSAQFVWEFDSQDARDGFVCVQYSSALNRYEKMADGGRRIVAGWDAGVYECQGVFRKEESDWKKSYLCRTESSNEKPGHVAWKFKITDEQFVFDTVEYTFERYTVENGCVSIKICSNDKCFLLTTDNGTTDEFIGNNELTITATLSGGKGDIAWQHAQLCREDLSKDIFTMKLSFKFKIRH